MDRERKACWELVAELLHVEMAYAVQWNSYPSAVVVLAGEGLYAALEGQDGAPMCEFQAESGRLVVTPLRSQVVVARWPVSPRWGFTVVAGTMRSGLFDSAGERTLVVPTG